MSKWTKLCGVAAVCSLILGIAGNALAVKPFYDEFKKVYSKPDSSDSKEKQLAEAIDKASCQVCHVGKNRKLRNAYGQEIAKLLSKKTDLQDKKKMDEAFKKVEDMHSDPKDSKSATFGSRLKDGLLPSP